MPVFEYVCQRCGRVFEKFTLRASVDPGVCPACGSEDVRRKLSSFASKGHGGGGVGSCAPSG